MLKIGDDGSISLTRGDTARLTVSINNDVDGKEYEIQPGDVLYLTIKKNVKDTEPALQKRNHSRIAQEQLPLSKHSEYKANHIPHIKTHKPLP